LKENQNEENIFTVVTAILIAILFCGQNQPGRNVLNAEAYWFSPKTIPSLAQIKIVDFPKKEARQNKNLNNATPADAGVFPFFLIFV